MNTIQKNFNDHAFLNHFYENCHAIPSGFKNQYHNDQDRISYFICIINDRAKIVFWMFYSSKTRFKYFVMQF